MVVASTYRNKKMLDVDFYVTHVNKGLVVGYWVSRQDGMILGGRQDSILNSRIKPEDWQEVR